MFHKLENLGFAKNSSFHKLGNLGFAKKTVSQFRKILVLQKISPQNFSDQPKTSSKT
jgi:hypothetical protein